MQNDTVTGMVKATAQSAPPITSSIVLWFFNHDAAWWVSVLTAVYVISQLFWGWRKFFKGEA
ncbi:MAG: hypothetical protein V4796_32425 [Burkholderia cenocepacia]